MIGLTLQNNMEVFLIRHGQTTGNMAGRHQEDRSDITEKGKLQATLAAQIVTADQPTKLITSTMLRAVETARIVGLMTDLIPETNAMFAEIEKPKRLNGHLLKSIYSLWFYTRWYLGWTTKREGGESYKELRERIKAGKEYLVSHGAEAKIAVVSHSAYINFFLLHLDNDRPAGPLRAALCFFKILTIKNGTVIHLTYDAKREEKGRGWKVEKHL